MDVNTLAIGGVSLPLLIQVAIGLAKKLGFPTDYCPHLSVALGMIGAVGIAIIGSLPWYYGIVAGVMLGGLTCGIYDAGQGKLVASSDDTKKTTA